MITEEEALAIWRRALQSPIGIAVQTNDRNNVLRRLYQIRLRHRDKEDFSDLMLKVDKSVPIDEIWVIYKPIVKEIKPMDEGDLDEI